VMFTMGFARIVLAEDHAILGEGLRADRAGTRSAPVLASPSTLMSEDHTRVGL
jgi:hypothetical protein